MILLVANSRDFATDFVVAELLRRGVSYNRLDIDLLDQDRISLDPVNAVLTVESHDRETFSVSGSEVTAILYRAPTFLRESSGAHLSAPELLQRHQWAAFARSLMLFDQAIWINDPRKVYAAECKPYQLYQANRHGFTVPATLVCNAPFRDAPVWNTSGTTAVKALDSFLLHLDDSDAFFYTRELAIDDATPDKLSGMPVILQRWIENKLDIRVTVVGDQCFAASVSFNGASIPGDWRLAKNEATFAAHDLPGDVGERCLALNKSLGLVFGAIDLALVDDTYYFLEVNPTGEWAWLMEPTGHRIDRAMADALCGPEN